jgi:hypothetical protein
MTSIPIAINWQRRRLVNETLSAYLDWREECSGVALAYSRWASSRASDASATYAAYAAALEREERASELYAGVVRRVGSLLGAAPALADAGQVPR